MARIHHLGKAHLINQLVHSPISVSSTDSNNNDIRILFLLSLEGRRTGLLFSFEITKPVSVSVSVSAVLHTCKFLQFTVAVRCSYQITCWLPGKSRGPGSKILY